MNNASWEREYTVNDQIVGLAKPPFGWSLDELSALFPIYSKEYVIENLKSFFSKKDYKYLAPESTIPKNHESVLFTNSAILNLLSQIKNNTYEWRFYTVQPCLRVQNFSQPDNETPEYMSCFTMPGIFTTAQEYKTLCTDTINFLTLLFPKDRIRIAYDPKHSLHKEYREKSDIPYKSHPYNYYDRKFGDKRIDWSRDDFSSTLLGEWASILLNNGREFEEVGNIIVIKQNNVPLYTSFWFWIETMLSILNSREIHQVFFTNAGEKLSTYFLNHKDPYVIRLIDTFQIIAELNDSGIKPHNKKEWYIMTKSLKKIRILSQSLALSHEKVSEMFRLLSLPEELVQSFKFYNNIHD